MFRFRGFVHPPKYLAELPSSSPHLDSAAAAESSSSPAAGTSADRPLAGPAHKRAVGRTAFVHAALASAPALAGLIDVEGTESYKLALGRQVAAPLASGSNSDRRAKAEFGPDMERSCSLVLKSSEIFETTARFMNYFILKH